MFKEEVIKQIKLEEEKWEREKVAKVLSKTPELKKEFTTLSRIPVKRLYTPADIGKLDYFRDLGFSGEYPYTRGIHPTGHRGRIWTMRLYAGYGSAEDTNKRYKYLLQQGQTGLSVAFNLPTQLGYDSDHPLAQGEVGKTGVAIDSLEDMERLFDGIPLSKVSTSMTINSTAPMVLAMYIAVAEKQGADISKLDGTIQNDMLKEYIARNTQIFPPKPSMRLVTDIIEYCCKHMPRWNFISISGYHIREAGATAVQEIAFTLANAIAYVQAALARGLKIDDFAPRISFFLSSGNDIFEEVAKFRAVRRMWAKIMRERFGAKDPRSWQFRFHVQTPGHTLTAQQPLNNIIRTAFQALAAVLGGVQSLHTNSYDEALCLPTEHAVMVALRTQQIIAYETGVTNTVDPLAGSYYVEWLTDEIEKQAFEYIYKIDQMGGALAAIESGYIAREILESAYKYQKEIDSGERVIVGVNKYTIEEEIKIPILRPDPEVERLQKARLAALKQRRDNKKVKECLEKLRIAAMDNVNLMPVILEAVKAYATIGEMCDVLREVFGEYKQPVLL
ncbi:MAG: methylmalonyl-CoA mutase family protein [Methanocellales archaeon]